MRQPAFFNAQFFQSVGGVVTFASDCLLYTRPAGDSGSLQTSWTDQAGAVPNANPIVLDAEGRCDLWLSETLEYLLELRDAADAIIWQQDNVAGAAAAADVAGGAATIDPADIPYGGPALTWFTPTNVQDALDQLATRADAIPADSVPIADVGTLFTATNVEDALAELAVRQPGKLLRITPFLSVGGYTWTKGADVGSIYIKTLAGGGGSATTTNASGGGGGGGAAEAFIAAPAANYAVTVGDGGNAGAAGTPTSVGTVCAASGGNAGGTTKGGTPGVGTIGDLLLRGQGGGFGAETSGLYFFGAGGNSPYGGGARGNVGGGSGDGANEAGQANSGGGASGGTGGGAKGGSGAVWVYEYAT